MSILLNAAVRELAAALDVCTDPFAESAFWTSLKPREPFELASKLEIRLEAKVEAVEVFDWVACAEIRLAKRSEENCCAGDELKKLLAALEVDDEAELAGDGRFCPAEDAPETLEVEPEPTSDCISLNKEATERLEICIAPSLFQPGSAEAASGQVGIQIASAGPKRVARPTIQTGGNGRDWGSAAEADFHRPLNVFSIFTRYEYPDVLQGNSF